jgi:hypothetical protein
MDQPIIGVWAVTRAIIFEYTSDPIREPYFNESERRWVAENRIPPDRASVWLAMYDFRQWLRWAHAQDLTINPGPPSGAPFQAYLSTFVVGFLIFQVFSQRSPDRPTVRLETGQFPPLIPVWPIVGIQTWPTYGPLPATEVQKMADPAKYHRPTH